MPGFSESCGSGFGLAGGSGYTPVCEGAEGLRIPMVGPGAVRAPVWVRIETGSQRLSQPEAGNGVSPSSRHQVPPWGQAGTWPVCGLGSAEPVQQGCRELENGPTATLLGRGWKSEGLK